MPSDCAKIPSMGKFRRKELNQPRIRCHQALNRSLRRTKKGPDVHKENEDVDKLFAQWMLFKSHFADHCLELRQALNVRPKCSSAKHIIGKNVI